MLEKQILKLCFQYSAGINIASKFSLSSVLLSSYSRSRLSNNPVTCAHSGKHIFSGDMWSMILVFKPYSDIVV